MVCVCHRIYESSGSLWFVYATGCWDSPTTPTINFQSMGGGGGSRDCSKRSEICKFAANTWCTSLLATRDSSQLRMKYNVYNLLIGLMLIGRECED